MTDTNKAIELATEGLYIDGAHHKQWYLERVLEALSVDLDTLRSEHHKVDGYAWDKGIAP